MTVEGYLPNENRESYLARIASISSPDIDLTYAYDFAKAAHRGEHREGGRRVFEHPRNVALILIDECRIQDPNIIAASLLHDVAEDTIALGSATGKNYAEWIGLVRYRTSALFNAHVSDMVVSLTKPPKQLEDIQTGGKSLEIYRRILREASADALLVKMADRLHNLRTLSDTPREKQERKIQETIDHYSPLFERVKAKYPSEYEYLRKQIDLAIEQLEL